MDNKGITEFFTGEGKWHYIQKQKEQTLQKILN